MEIIEGLKWRYATKKFDKTRKINDTDLKQIMEAVRLSASSFGLQLYKILFIQDQELRERLKQVSFGQPQITDASHLVVFCNYSSVEPAHVDKYIELIAKTRNLDTNDLSGFGDTMKQSIEAKSPETVAAWTAKQTYIALGTLLAATAELGIDACPMEGFKPAAYNEILGLNERGLNAAVIATIGYRSPEDQYQFYTKVRKSPDVLFETI